MKTNKTLFAAIIGINIIGVICLIYFAVPFIAHDTAVNNPDAMLPVEAWDAAGMALTIGLIPLTVVNISGYFFVAFREKAVRLLWFLPSIFCLTMVISYLALSL